LDKDRTRTGVAARLRKDRWTVLGAAFVGLAVAGAASIVLPKSWLSTAEMEVSARHAVSDEEFATSVHEAAERMRSVGTLRKVVESQRLGQTPDMPAAPDYETQIERWNVIAERLADGASVSVGTPEGGTCRLQIELRDRDPAISHRALQALLGTYRTEIHDRPLAVQEDAIETARGHAAQATARTADALRALAEWDGANGEFLGDVDVQMSEVQSSIRRIEEEELPQARKAQAAADEVLKTEEPNRRKVVKQTDAAALAVIDGKLADAEARLKELTWTLAKGESDPEVLETKAALAALAQQKADLEKSAPESVEVSENPLYAETLQRSEAAKAAVLVAERQLASLRKNERLLQDKLRKSPELKSARERLSAALEAAKKTEKERAAAVTEAERKLGEMTRARHLEFRIVSSPEPPQSPAGAPPALFALCGLVVGAAGGFAYAYAADAKDRSFRDADSVAELLGVPAIGAVPAIVTSAELAEERGRARRKAAVVALLGCAALAVAGWATLVPVRPAGTVAEEGPVR
jgi:uncharacterized protein involved in exopolysaccharide biosynthesis